MKPIFVMGLPGVGKTAAIQELQKRGVMAADSDEALEDEVKQPVRDYFLKVGEQAFREQEKRVVQTIAKTNRVISLGGGAFLDEKPAGYVVFFKDEPLKSLKRLLESKGLPAYLDHENIEKSYLELARKRERIYASHADIVLEVSEKNPVDMAHEIITLLVRNYGLE